MNPIFQLSGLSEAAASPSKCRKPLDGFGKRPLRRTEGKKSGHFDNFTGSQLPETNPRLVGKCRRFPSKAGK
jgi:hypothetical protein